MNATILKTLLLFLFTALAEIIGCWLPYLWLRQGKSVWLLLPAAASLALFAYLLTLHPAASGRIYAAYGGVYIVTALSGCALQTAYYPKPATGWARLCVCAARQSSLGAAVHRPKVIQKAACTLWKIQVQAACNLIY